MCEDGIPAAGGDLNVAGSWYKLYKHFKYERRYNRS
jgi:hypothetical protein